MRIALLTTDSREHFKDYKNPTPYFGTAPEALIEGFQMLPDAVEVHIVSCLHQTPVSSPRKLADNIYYHGLHVPKWGWMRTGYQGCIRAVRRKLREIHPDIVHGQGTERDCAVSAALSGFPNVLTIHGHMSRIAELTHAKPLTYYWIAKQLERFCLRRTGGAICLTSYTARMVAPYAGQIWTVPNAVHPSFFDVVRSPSDPPRILCAANVHPWKNQTGLIKAADPLQAANDFKLVFAGAGNSADPYFREFSRMVAARPWCEYLGPLDRDDLKNQMSRAALCILPSFEDNCPMVVLEASAAGLPVAASAVGGIPDLVEHGRTGLLFDPHDPFDVTEKIGEMLGNRTGAEAMAEFARTLCRERNAYEHVALRHIEIYRSLASPAGATH